MNGQGWKAASEGDSVMGKARPTISQYLFYDPAAAHRKLHVSLDNRLEELESRWRSGECSIP